MFSCRNLLIAVGVCTVLTPVLAADDFSGIGRAATESEVAAWDIDVRPDFQGLPDGSGTVEAGMDVWENTCAACHGVFGEDNAWFTPLIGGTTADDVESGHVANLKRSDYPGVTTIMKVPTVSTLWDFINRAMPWNAPKSLSTDDVYAVTAYMLNMADIVDDDFTLSNENIAEVQERMPNRKGMTTEHAMWPGKEFGSGGLKPDTHAKACMKDCDVPQEITSDMPRHAESAWGNLRDQNRLVGPQLGQVTLPDGVESSESDEAVSEEPVSMASKAAELTQKNGCTACHSVDNKLIGPSFKEIAEKYPDGVDYLAEKIISGGSGVWGDVPMPPQALAEDDAAVIAAWLAKGASTD